MWTRFMDMHSGGGQKEKYEEIYIEAPEEEAFCVFYNRFGHSPYHVTCSCCGEDYSTYEFDTLENATEFYCGSSTVEEYGQREDILYIYSTDIKPEDLEDPWG